MQEIIAAIAAKAGLDAAQAESALGIILNFLHKEGPTSVVEELAARFGATELLNAAPAGGGGLLGALGGMFGGAGGAMAALGQLKGAGLDMDQIQSVVSQIIDEGRARIGDEQVDKILASIPGLAQFL